MEEIKVHINRLGRVYNSDLTIKPFMLFSGDSGLGKSYLASLCHYFYRFLGRPNILYRLVKDSGYDYQKMSKDFVGEGTAFEINKKQLEDWISKDCVRYVGYLLGNKDIEGDVAVELPSAIPENMKLSYREEKIGIVGEEESSIILSFLGTTIRVGSLSETEVSPFAQVIRYGLSSVILEASRAITMTPVLPPSRGAFLTEDVSPKTGMYEDYKEFLNNLEIVQIDPVGVDENLINIVHNVIEGDVQYNDGKYFYAPNGVKAIPISSSAASIRELAPIDRLVKYTDIAKTAILFEEPETHLHPAKQRMMADVMGALLNAGAKLIITTHSNYFIARLNELIQFYRLKNRGTVSAEQLKELRSKLKIEKGVEFDSEAMGVYMLRLRENGLSEVVPQDLEDGVPYTAFLQATKDDIFNRDILTKAFEDVAE